MDRPTLSDAAVAVLQAGDAGRKVTLTEQAAADWHDGRLTVVGDAVPPDRPARPARPPLRPPREMPKRGKGATMAGRVALLHAVAHIELNAIDLAWDLIARFGHVGWPKAFYDDWVGIAAEEAKHFALLSDRLASLGAAYGDLPAHDGLWLAAADTAHCPVARLSVVPMVLEARGLDVTPNMIARMRAFGDRESAGVLSVIYRDEIGHVATGRHWFEYICRRRGLAPMDTWRSLVRRHVPGAVKPPFNDAAREAAGMGAAFYKHMAGEA